MESGIISKPGVFFLLHVLGLGWLQRNKNWVTTVRYSKKQGVRSLKGT